MTRDGKASHLSCERDNSQATGKEHFPYGLVEAPDHSDRIGNHMPGCMTPGLLMVEGIKQATSSEE